MADFKTLFGKYVYILTAVALLGGGGLFAYLQSVGLDISCEDKVCEVGVECPIHCEVYNPTSQSIYLYNYDDWKIIFSPDIVEADLYVKYYGKWRYTNFTKETRFGNIPDDAKYVFVFPKKTTKYFQVRAVVSEPTTIKWDFGELDPLISAYEYTYENLSRQVPVYNTTIVQIDCNHKGKVKNISCKNVSYPVETLIGYKREYYHGKKIGVDVNGTIYSGKGVNVKDNYIVEWSVPIGDRNMRDFGRCRDFEKAKGVCREEKLI